VFAAAAPVETRIRSMMGGVVRAVRWALLLLSCGACRSSPEPTVRQDLAPLARRVDLPSGVRSARWVALPAYTDSGWLEAPERPHRLYVWLELSAPAPARSGSTSQVIVPKDVASRILPSTVSTAAAEDTKHVTVTGAPLAPPPQPRDSRTSVEDAVAIGGGALLVLFARDE